LAPPIGGSDSISLNSPDLISLSAALGSHISRSHLSISLLPQSLRLSLSYCVRARKGRKKTKKEEEGRIRREEKKSGRGAVRELKEEGEVGWVAREVGGERVDRIGLLSILLFYF
jgi:hypothetical protein